MFYDGSGAVPVVLYQTNVMSLMVYSELKTYRHYHCIFLKETVNQIGKIGVKIKA